MITTKNIGNVFPIKQGEIVYSIAMQERVSFPELVFVKLTNIFKYSNDMMLLFGTIVKPNMFGPLNTTELSFYEKNIDKDEKSYASVEEFNKEKSYYPIMSFFGNCSEKPLNELKGKSITTICDQEECPKKHICQSYSNYINETEKISFSIDEVDDFSKCPFFKLTKD